MFVEARNVCETLSLFPVHVRLPACLPSFSQLVCPNSPLATSPGLSLSRCKRNFTLGSHWSKSCETARELAHHRVFEFESSVPRSVARFFQSRFRIPSFVSSLTYSTNSLPTTCSLRRSPYPDSFAIDRTPKYFASRLQHGNTKSG